MFLTVNTVNADVQLVALGVRGSIHLCQAYNARTVTVIL